MMRSSRKSQTDSPGAGTVDTLVGRQTEVLGDVVFTGGLHVDGTVKGRVSARDNSHEATLSVSESGVIEGDVHVANIVLNGSVQGDVHAAGKLTMDAKARVNGNVHYRAIEMAAGATINGQMVHEAEAGTRASVTPLEPRGEWRGDGAAERPRAGNGSDGGSVKAQ